MTGDPPTILNTFTVSYAYPVVFTRHVWDPANHVLRNAVLQAGNGVPPPACLVLLDAGLVEAMPGLPAQVTAYCRQHADTLGICAGPHVLRAGEPCKDGLETALDVSTTAAADGLCRQSLVVAVGGGAFLDAVGLGAALLHRGVRLIRLPTTVLSQSDSGVGVKNGVNLLGCKNLIGTFACPVAVINDACFLRTLPHRDWVAGISEAFKVGAIRDVGFLRWLEDHAEALFQRDSSAMETLIHRCASLHCLQISRGGDPFELGSSRPLDFGHWAAHKLESMSGFEMRHGEAVAVGIAIDLMYAAGRGYIAADEAARVIVAMARCGLPVWHPALLVPEGCRLAVLSGLEEFRQHLGGELHVTLPAPLGQRLEVTTIDEDGMTDAVQRLAHVVENMPRTAPL